MTDASELLPSLEADQLLRALGVVRADQRGALEKAVTALVAHKDPDVREEALRVLFVHWHAADLRDIAERAFHRDDSPAVRAIACTGLLCSVSQATLENDIRALLSTIKNESEDPMVRESAYDALLVLYRRSPFRFASRPFAPATDVDWNWLAQVEQDVRSGLLPPQPDRAVWSRPR